MHVSIRFRARLAALLALMLVVPLSAWPADAAADDRDNAATWYRHAMAELEATTLSEREEKALHELIETEPSAVTPAEARWALSKLQPTLELARQGAQQPYCDFELDYSKGIELLLPHLSPMRRIARWLTADMTMRERDGDLRTAMRDTDAIYRISLHLQQDQVLISSLVGVATFRLGDGRVARAIDHGTLDATQAQLLLSALELADADDPFGMIRSTEGERDIFGEWMRERYGGEDGAAKLLSDTGDIGDEETNAETIAAISEDGIDIHVDGYQQAMTDAIEIMRNPDADAAKEAFKAFESELESGKYGQLAMFMTPALGRIDERRRESAATLAERAELLRLLASGEKQPIDLMNAALFYQEAIDALRALPMEQRCALLRFGEGEALSSEEQSALLKALEEPLRLVRLAATRERCTMALLHDMEDRELPRLLPSYVESLSELSDAIRLQEQSADRADAAVEAADALLRFSLHLGTDDRIAAALLSERVLNRAAARIEQLVARGTVDDAQRQMWRELVAARMKEYPLHLAAAITATRPKVQGHLLGTVPGAAERRDEWLERTNTWPPELMLSVHAVIDARRDADEERESADAEVDAASNAAPAGVAQPEQHDDADECGLTASHRSRLYEADALEAIRRRSTEVAVHLMSGELDEVEQSKLPSILDIAAHQRDALLKLQHLLHLLRPDDDAAATGSPATPEHQDSEDHQDAEPTKPIPGLPAPQRP